MKNKNLQGMFNLIDDEFIEEADPTKRRKKPSISKYIWLQIATCAACLILTLNTIIAIPLLLLKDDDDIDNTPSTDVVDGDYDKHPGFKPSPDKDSSTDTEAESTNNDTAGTEPGSDTEVDVDTNTDTNEAPENSDTELDTDTSEGTSTEIATDSSVETETDITTDTETESDDKDDANVKIEYIQNITNIHITVPGKDTNIISLSSPLLSAPSEYDKIIKSMQEIADGRLDILDKDKVDIAIKDESNGDLIDKVEEELENAGESSSSSNKYHETTDLQVDGVVEGDIIKRSDKYIYYLSGTDLRVYSMGMNAEFYAYFSIEEYVNIIKESLEIPLPEGELNEYEKDKIEQDRASVNEMFLSPDCKTITIIYDDYIDIGDYINSKTEKDRILEYGWDHLYYTVMVSLSVEDLNNIHLSGITTLFGEYQSARYVDNEFLVFTKYIPREYDFIIPQYNDGEGFKLFPVDKITEPSTYSCENYLLAYRLNDSCKIIDLGAYASFDGHIYVSGDNIYLTREYWEDLRIEEPKPEEGIADKLDDVKEEEDFITSNETYLVESLVTEIIRVSYEDGKFVTNGTVKVDGYLKDRYSLSENDTVLYVVTTESGKYSYTPYKYDEDEDILLDWIDTSSKTSASIYCVDIVNMEVLSSVKRFAPEGEIVRAVQYDGFYAYVCTSVLVTDPVFFFNLWDVDNIKYSETGTIPGFSTSLIDFGNGELLGIGVDGKGNVKVEVYKEGENNTVEIIDTYIIKGTYSTDYKSYYINREYGLFGFGLFDSSQEDASRYVMLQYRNGYLTEVFNKTLRGVNYSKRAVFDGSYFYLVSENDFTYFKRLVQKP